ncbi:MAG TPA: transglutaminase domain-containing protein [Pyrinomonadaceae bacterium]|nr:transglutaminase domain-containing protein [Pyrinomonadaceae bacterium]
MRKLLLLLIVLFGCTVPANAQLSRQQEREAEWKAYALPQTNFARQINADKNFVFRVPANWQQQGAELTFTGPHNSRLAIIVDKIPDGYPLQEYFASMLRRVRDTPTADTLITRRTQIQEMEARELVIDTPNDEGEMYRNTSWITVNGPMAITFMLQAPVPHDAELEPYFKAVVQSVIFVPLEYPAFERLRSSTIKSPAPGPIHEIESIVATLNEVNANREVAIGRLSSLFSSHADAAVDLLLDRRPFVRTAAVQALARSNNAALSPFLWYVLDDDESLVAEAAARAVASAPDVVGKTLYESMSGFDTETIARVWQFMPKEKRIELLQKIFSETAVVRTAGPPPPAMLPPGKPPARKAPSRPSVTVIVGKTTPVKPGMPVPDITVGVANDPNVQIGALTLLNTIPHEEFKLPLARIVASQSNPLIAMGLQVANLRGESLPLDSLFKLVSSSDSHVSKHAAQSLGLSATVTDIPRVEALISKDSASAKKELDDELKLSVKKIRFRQELGSAKSTTESREIIHKALSDPSLADFAWRFDCEPSVAGCSANLAPLKTDFTVKPFAENLFPKKVRHYTAIPNPAQAVQKFYETLNGMQLESPRAQSNLTLTMGYVRQSLALELGAPVDATTLIEYTGIDPNSPIAFGAWTAERALDSTASAERKAIVLRVKDRARFERIVERIQQSTGAFMNLTDYVAASTRAIAALPATLPLMVQADLPVDTKKPLKRIVLRYSTVGEKVWNGLRVKTIEHYSVNSDWVLQGAATHIVFVGNTVILTPDLATIRDLLGNASDRQYLADNPEFRNAIERRGDVVYFSDLKAVLANISGQSKPPDFYKLNESGSLNITSASWENSHHLDFDEGDWSKPLLPFHPKELSAPRDLLPAKTIAYWLMKIDLPAFWSTRFTADLLGSNLQNASKLLAVDFKQDVLTELGPECGAILLELPKLASDADDPTWAAFCKLKSNKLVDLLNAGKLFSGVGPTKDFAEVKAGDKSYFVAARNGFLLVSNHNKAFADFDGKTSLATTRDYSRAVEKVPAGIVAFGGYNLEAAIAAAINPSVQGTEAMMANMVFSIASAFHSQNFFATATAGTIEAKSSVSMDREGRYAVADLSALPRSTITFATLEPTGTPITDANRLSSLVVKLRSKAAGPIDNIKDDIKTADQTVEQKSAKELLLTIAARRGASEKPVELPVKDPQFAEYLKATPEFAVDDQRVKEQARQIAGDDKDAWSVARKLADWTHKNLEWKHVLYASAAQTLATREADCSEFSALFVAMARSLGLPSRMVTGLAYSGSSFGGHAWVEVWAGKWIELDPTWGTHFVDATHIRNELNTLVMSAALNLIEMEVVETRRTVADFQKSPAALMQHLVKAIPSGARSDIEAALDLETLTDELMGRGSWSSMNQSERDQMWSAYRRFVKEIVEGYGDPGSLFHKMRLLRLEEKGNVAEATCLLASLQLLKLRLVRRNDLWSLVEILESDSNLYTASEALRPTIKRIENSRAGQKVPESSSDFARALVLLRTDAEKARATADAALKVKPGDQNLRFVKAMSLLSMETRAEDATKLLRELSNEGFAPAVYKLADHLNYSEDEKVKSEAIGFYERYTSLEPYDPRGYMSLASAYEAANDLVKAEDAYRKSLERDPDNTDRYLDLVHFLIVHDRIAEARAMLVDAEKHNESGEDLFGSALENLHILEETKNAEKFAASEPSKMKTSYLANLTLGHIYFDQRRYADAVRFLEAAAQIDKESADPYIDMALVYRKQSRFTAAVKAAQKAIELDDEDGEAYYQLACALTRLRRTKEALAALAKSVELDPDQAEYMVEEPDLKPLSSLREFKKLIPAESKQ